MRNFSAKQREPKKLESLLSINIEVHKNSLLLKAIRFKIATVIIILGKNYCFEFFGERPQVYSRKTTISTALTKVLTPKPISPPK